MALSSAKKKAPVEPSKEPVEKADNARMDKRIEELVLTLIGQYQEGGLAVPAGKRGVGQRGPSKTKTDLVMKKSERFLLMAFEVFEEMGGKDILIGEMMAQDSTFQRQFVKELFTLNKKWFDIAATRMRIDAEANSASRGVGDRTGAGRVTNVFIIKGLHDGQGREMAGKVIDVSPGASQQAAVARFQVNGLEAGFEEHEPDEEGRFDER
jgi:hypothetical protein